MSKIVIGITGSSGSIYGHRLILHLKQLQHEVYLICTEAGKKISEYEDCTFGFELADRIYSNNDLFAPLSSGSFQYDGMVIVPCSMGTLGKIASGIADNLLTRAADVNLKERKKLIIVPREFPLNIVHLKNMKILAEAGAVILPASPHFYHHPKSIENLIDTVLSRVLDHLNLVHSIGPRWEGK
jgi:4-hydroxy-3-polyprenylbenzoate decarboxylase